MENTIDNSKIRFQILSDLHLEFTGVPDILPPIDVKSDYIALLGDIGNPKSLNNSYGPFLHEQGSKFKEVFVVAGNHEYYGNVYSVGKSMIQDICSQKENIHFLDCNVFQVRPKVKIIGCTLWSFLPEEHQLEIQMRLNDFRKIAIDADDGPTAITPKDYMIWHTKERKWLEEQVEKAKENGEKLIIFTHHGPTFENSAAKEYLGKNTNHAFVTDMHYLLKEEPVLCWCYGHTHYSWDQIINGARVTSNQLGYIKAAEKTRFRENFVVEIDVDQSVLWKDIYLGKKEKVVETCKNNKNMISVVDFNGFTALHYACYVKQSEIAKELVEMGADVTVKTNEGKSVADIAAEQNELELAEYLVSKGSTLTKKEEPQKPQESKESKCTLQ